MGANIFKGFCCIFLLFCVAVFYLNSARYHYLAFLPRYSEGERKHSKSGITKKPYKPGNKGDVALFSSFGIILITYIMCEDKFGIIDLLKRIIKQINQSN